MHVRLHAIVFSIIMPTGVAQPLAFAAASDLPTVRNSQHRLHVGMGRTPLDNDRRNEFATGPKKTFLKSPLERSPMMPSLLSP
jgi:hypothetical protein